MRDLDTLLRTMSARSASDLHLKPTRPPLIRVHGKLVALEEEPLTPDEIHGMVDSILAPHQKRKLEERMSVDLGYGVRGLARFRCNVYIQRGTIAVAFRRIPYEIRDVETLNLPRCCSTSATCRWAWC
jgi:twitching motility protein PilT